MRRSLVVALSLALVSVAPSHAGHGTESRDYLAGTGDAAVLLCSERPSLGGACFDVPAGHGSARIRIIDQTGLPVGGAYRFEAIDGASLSRGSFCTQTATAVGIPSGARTLTVFVDTARSNLDCQLVAGVGTRGVVTVTWLG